MANQTFFKYIKRKITPAEIQKIMQKKDWFAPPVLLAGGAASLIFFENGSRIVQYLQPCKNRSIGTGFYMAIIWGLGTRMKHSGRRLPVTICKAMSQMHFVIRNVTRQLGLVWQLCTPGMCQIVIQRR